MPLPVDPELELQRKILDIMNKPSITTSVATATAPPPSVLPNAALEALKAVTAATSASSSTVSSTSGSGAVTSAGSTLLADPKVQMALDSLLSGNMFF